MSIIRVKRSGGTGSPSALAQGEMAYSFLSGTQSNGGDRLYIGTGTETSGVAANIEIIGGKYFTQMLDHAAGTLTASSALIVDANSKLDNFNVDNININGNTISTTNSNGNLVLSPNGTGVIDAGGKRITGGASPTANSDFVTLGFLNSSFSSNLTVAGNVGTDTIALTTETLTVTGNSGISTSVVDNTITISLNATSNVVFNTIETTGGLTVGGDLIVNGNTVTVSATNLSIEDNMIYLNSNSTVTNPDLGFAGNYNDGTYRHAGFFRDATDGVWKVFNGYTLEPDASPYIDTSHASFTLSNLQANTFVGALSGNATTATTLQTARTISLGGVLSGSASFNGSANVTITAAVVSNSIALGTDTAGNYAADVSVTTGTGLAITGSAGEGTSYVISGVNATTSVKGVASFNSNEFTVSSGAVSISAIDGGTY